MCDNTSRYHLYTHKTHAASGKQQQLVCIWHIAIHARTRDTQHLACSNTAGVRALYYGSNTSGNKADMRAPYDLYTHKTHAASGKQQ